MSTMETITIYHNNRCRKSREALDILEKKKAKLQIIDYLNNAPSEKELKSVLSKLGMKPEEIVRKGEDIFKKKFKGKIMSDADWIKALSKNPILIERPIVIKGNKAVVGRPPENIKKLL